MAGNLSAEGPSNLGGSMDMFNSFTAVVGRGWALTRSSTIIKG